MADHSGIVSVYMPSFNARFKVYSDNVHIFEQIKNSNGRFYSLDTRPYQKWLNEFAIFYTCTFKKRN